MARRRMKVGTAVASLAMVLQGVFAIAGPATAHATLPMVQSLCAFNTSSLASLDDPAQRGCRWSAIARAADVGIVHQNCTIEGTRRDDRLRGTGGKDVICGFQGDDVIKALGGNDIVYGGAGKDRILGDGGKDRLVGEDGNDRLVGGASRNSILGQLGNDVLIGGGRTDFMAGGYRRRSLLSGGSGDDFVSDTRGSDIANLGPEIRTSSTP